MILAALQFKWYAIGTITACYVYYIDFVLFVLLYFMYNLLSFNESDMSFN